MLIDPFPFFFFLLFIYFTSFREQDKAIINSLRWSAPMGLEPAYTHMWVARSTTVLQTPTFSFYCRPYTLFIGYFALDHKHYKASTIHQQVLLVYVGEGLRHSFATPDPFVLTNKVCLNQQVLFPLITNLISSSPPPTLLGNFPLITNLISSSPP